IYHTTHKTDRPSQARSALPARRLTVPGSAVGRGLGCGGRPLLAIRRAPLSEHRLVIVLEDVHKTFTVYRRARRLKRERGRVAAVDGVSFTIERGSMVGYIGPNGAGKSTTIKMLTGILVPTSGHIEVAGL